MLEIERHNNDQMCVRPVGTGNFNFRPSITALDPASYERGLSSNQISPSSRTSSDGVSPTQRQSPLAKTPGSDISYNRTSPVIHRKSPGSDISYNRPQILQYRPVQHSSSFSDSVSAHHRYIRPTGAMDNASIHMDNNYYGIRPYSRPQMGHNGYNPGQGRPMVAASTVGGNFVRYPANGHSQLHPPHPHYMSAARPIMGDNYRHGGIVRTNMNGPEVINSTYAAPAPQTNGDLYRYGANIRPNMTGAAEPVKFEQGADGLPMSGQYHVSPNSENAGPPMLYRRPSPGIPGSNREFSDTASVRSQSNYSGYNVRPYMPSQHYNARRDSDAGSVHSSDNSSGIYIPHENLEVYRREVKKSKDPEQYFEFGKQLILVSEGFILLIKNCEKTLLAWKLSEFEKTLKFCMLKL
jgi:hypothetical protein